MSRCEKDGTDSIKLLEGLATALDCAEGFLLGRLRQAASRMASSVLVDRPGTASHPQQRCARLLSHSAAPLTADDWQTLADLIDRAVPPAGGRQNAPSRQRLRLARGAPPGRAFYSENRSDSLGWNQGAA